MDGEQLASLIAQPEQYLGHPDPVARRLAVSSLVGTGRGTLDQYRHALDDEDAAVRAEAAEALGGQGVGAMTALHGARGDTEALVVEAIATSYGDIGDPTAVDWLIDQALDHADRSVREAAVAALGEIGDGRAVETLIRLSADAPPQVRRRAVVALTAFDGDSVEAAVRKAANDRNPMVREAAEMIVGRPVPEPG